MGVIRELDTGREFPLAARSLVGRASQCHIRLDASFVSREHASIEYVDGHYYIKDLSVNGVEVGGKLIERGELVALRPGVEVALGRGLGAPRLALLEDGAPLLVAHELDSRRVVGVLQGCVLRLPLEGDAPDAAGCVEVGYDEQLGAFLFMNAGSDSVSQIRNEQILRIGASLWMIHLPSDDSRTSSASDFPVDLRSATLKLITDESCEAVEVRVLPHATDAQAIRGVERTIVSRSRYAETLLALAMKKRDDLEAGVPEHNAGWLTNEALISKVGSLPGADGNLPYLHPYRLKRLFEAANVRGLGLLFQRESGALRLGLSDFEVVVRERLSEVEGRSTGRRAC